MFRIKNSSRDSSDFAICREDYVALLEGQNGHDHVVLSFLGNAMVIFFQTDLNRKKLNALLVILFLSLSLQQTCNLS